jgi:hypothetical protein
MRGAILFSGFVILLSIFVGARSDRKTRRKLIENERQIELLRTRGYEALREEIEHEKGKDAA